MRCPLQINDVTLKIRSAFQYIGDDFQMLWMPQVDAQAGCRNLARVRLVRVTGKTFKYCIDIPAGSSA